MQLYSRNILLSEGMWQIHINGLEGSGRYVLELEKNIGVVHTQCEFIYLKICITSPLKEEMGGKRKNVLMSGKEKLWKD